MDEIATCHGTKELLTRNSKRVRFSTKRHDRCLISVPTTYWDAFCYGTQPQFFILAPSFQFFTNALIFSFKKAIIIYHNVIKIVRILVRIEKIL